MYILWLQIKQILMLTLTGLLRGVLNRPVKILCANFRHIYIFYDVLFWFYHIRCLNILQFGRRFYFWDRKKISCTLIGVLFSNSIFRTKIFEQQHAIICHGFFGYFIKIKKKNESFKCFCLIRGGGQCFYITFYVRIRFGNGKKRILCVIFCTASAP